MLSVQGDDYHSCSKEKKNVLTLETLTMCPSNVSMTKVDDRQNMLCGGGVPYGIAMLFRKSYEVRFISNE